MKLTYKEYLSIALILAVIGVLGVLWQKPNEALGNISREDAMLATTTPTLADRTNLCPARPTGMASSTTGVLGSVIVTAQGSGAMQILDGTTTNQSLRAANMSTSSMIIADFPVRFATSTEFNVQFKYGLLIDYTSGVSTSTITYRCDQ